MTPEMLGQLLALGRETRRVEFKAAGPLQRNSDLTLRVIRSIMGLANTPDGGHVVVGVEENAEGQPVVVAGISAQDLATWTQDDLGALLANHSDPRVAFHLLPPVLHNGAKVLPIQVDEFSDAPVVCVRDGQAGPKQILKEGAVYVRGEGRVETRAIDSYAEMRSLLDLSVKKGLRRFVEQAHAAGMRVGPPGPTDVERFATEATAFPTHDALEAMRGRGYWRFVFRPGPYNEVALPDVPSLERTIRENSVSFRGWDFPHVDEHARVERRQRHVFQLTEMKTETEAWCFFQSAQFIYERPLSPFTRGDDDRQTLHYQDTINTITEAFAFASRLSVVAAYGQGVHLALEARGLDGRRLVCSDFVLRRPTPYAASGDDPFTHSWSGPRDDLIANWRNMALEVAANLFHRFTLDVSPSLLRDFQSQLLARTR